MATSLRSVAETVRPLPLPIYMVAGSEGRSALRTAGSRPASLGPLVCFALTVTMADNTLSALPLFQKERPTAEAVRAWLDEAKPLLRPDETSLVDGDTPRTLIQYRDSTVPDALVAGAADATTGITAAHVATRAMQIQSVVDENSKRLEQRKSHLSEIEDGFFKKLQVALKPNAPLLLNRLEAQFKQTLFTKRHIGSAAWKHIETMSLPAAMLAGEDSVHDIELARLVLKPLSDEASPDEFAKRVSSFMKDHEPYLERPFKDKASFSKWIVNQCPGKHRPFVLSRFEDLSTTDKGNPHLVLQMIVDFMAASRTPLQVLKDSTVSDFVGLVDEPEPVLMLETGRRPHGLTGGRGGRDGGRGGGRDGGRGRARGGRTGGNPGTTPPGADARPTGCSVAPPRGPMC